MIQRGYVTDFIGNGITVPVPGFSPRIAGLVLKNPELRDEIYADYVHYSLVMNKQTKQLIFSASNIDQSLQEVFSRKHSKSWQIDNRVGQEHQLNNDHYANNVWDKGHMVQRDNSNWGESENNRRLANDDTFFYTNASFQHENFNRDEWLALEKYFGGFEEDLTNKLCVFTGPIHLEYDRFYTRNWHDSVRIPSGFFKIICYQDKDSQQLATKAFILFQDDDMSKDRKGGSKLKFTNYQVTISEIEELTGLEFDESLFSSNPLYYNEYQDKAEKLGIKSFPERSVVTSAEGKDILEADSKRTPLLEEEERNVIMTAAMVNPSGKKEYQREWITIQNISYQPVDLEGWKLVDHKDRVIDLEGTISSGSFKKINMRDYKSIKLANTGATLILKNNKGEIVDLQKYVAREVTNEDMAIRF